VVTSPLWVPALVSAAPATAEVGAHANLVRIAVEEVGGVKVRIVEQEALEYIDEIGAEAVEQVKRAVVE
jgi:hypothetical protein